MPTNPARRKLLADAGLRVLADAGARGLTHRAVDAEAGVPVGTCSNYFGSRDELLGALAEHIFVRIGPTQERLDELADREPDLDLLVDYIRYIVERTTEAPELTIALFELRLEARRRPTLATTLGDTLVGAYRDDVGFNLDRGLPGGAAEIALLRFAIDGLLLDRLTVPVAPELETDDLVDAIVRRLVGPVGVAGDGAAAAGGATAPSAGSEGLQ